MQACPPFTRREGSGVDKVQARTTKRVNGLSHLAYLDLFCALNLYGMECRGLRGNLGDILTRREDPRGNAAGLAAESASHGN